MIQIGTRFGLLTVTGTIVKPLGKWNSTFMVCVCDCGSIRHNSSSALLKGKVKSCGCNRVTRTHGMHDTPENTAWRHMKDRCLNPKSQRYDRYGARGIKVCERWLHSFENFFNDVGPRPSSLHSIERLDVNGDYEPSNVIWAMAETQNNNKANSRHLVYLGERLTVSQWSRKLGIGCKTLLHRLAAGWSVEAVLTTPVAPRRWTRSPAGYGSKIPLTRLAVAS